MTRRRYFARRVWAGAELGRVIAGDYACRDNFVTYALERHELAGQFNIYRGPVGSSFLVAQPCGAVVLGEIVEVPA